MGIEARNVERVLAVGAVAVLHSEPHRKDGPRFKSVVRGWRKGAHLLLDRARHESGSLAALNEGQPCVIRYLHEGQACAFDSMVLDWDTRKHAPYMRVAWPEQIEFMSFRRYERVKVMIPVRFTGASGEVSEGEMVDLSIGGCGLEGRTPVEAGSRIQMDFTLPEGRLLEGIKAVVKSGRPSKSGHFLGCEFQGGQMAVESDVAFFVSRLLELQRQDSGDTMERRVLIMEADPKMSAKLRKQLERQQFDTVMAGNLIDAFHRFRAAPPSAVVVNQHFADLAGTEVCRILCQASEHEAVPVFLYGSEADDFEAQAEASGAAGAFPKCPSMAPDLAFALSQKLGKPGG